LSRNRWSLEEHEQEQGDNRQNICRNGEQERLYFDLSGALIFFFRANYEPVSPNHYAIFTVISQKNAVILRINYG